MIRRVLVLLLLSLALVAPSGALDIDRRLAQLQHTAWTSAEGAPAEVVAIEQTKDGYLWLGTTGGLYRFDGLAFERVDLFPEGGGLGHTQDIYTMALGRDGALWIGFRIGGVLRWTGSTATSTFYGREAGLPAVTVFTLLQDQAGAVWATTPDGAFRLQGDRWLPVGESEGLGRQFVRGLVESPDGTLWIGGSNASWFSRKRGGARFEPAQDMQGMADIAFTKDGRRWLLDADARLLLGTPAMSTVAWRMDYDGAVLPDRDGSLWVNTFGRGIRRIARPDLPPLPGGAQAVEAMDQRGGLSADRVLSGFVDRDGCVWFGTVNGLDRFRPARAVPAPYADGPGPAVLASLADGSVLAGPLKRPPTRLRADGSAVPIRGDYQPRELSFGAAWSDASGGAWIGAYPDLWRLEGDAMRRIPAPPDVPRLYPVQTVGRDAQGSVWAAWWGSGLRRLAEGGWEPASAESAREQVLVVQVDDRGGLWRGLLNGEAVRRDVSGERRYGPGDGLDLGMILAIHVRADQVTLGGEAGAARWVDGRFHRLTVVGEPGLRTVSGIVESADGDLWLNDASGILRIRHADLARWDVDPSMPVPVERLDWRDGVLGSSPQVRGLPSAAVDRDGRLWFSRNTGVWWIDPKRPLPALSTPAVVVTRASADEQRLPVVPGDIELAPGPQAVAISYTAPVPGAPERVRFRHRLLGLESDWQPVTLRREAVFTHLPPGRYRFEVQALEEGRWQSPVTALGFAVRPAFHQTAGFRLALAVLAASVLWLFYRWRLAAAGRRIRERIEARLTERERIARELHDTLLQGTLGLTLQVQQARARLAPDDPVRDRLSSVLDQADASIIEARERVQGLRRHQQDQELAHALENFALGARGAADLPEIRAKRSGAPRPLAPAAWDELFRMGAEAVQNALRHAHASRVDILLAYSSKELVLDIADDGRGMDGTAEGTRPDGHFGLRGMEERAAHLGGHVEILSTPGEGTSVRIALRGASVYAVTTGRWSALLGRE